VIEKLAAWCAKPGGILLFIIPLALLRVTVWASLPGEHDWGEFSVYLTFFVYGYLLFSRPAFVDAIYRQRWIALSVGVVSRVLMVGAYGAGYLETWAAAPIFSAGALLYQVIPTIYTWACLTFVLACGVHWLNFPTYWLPEANEAVLPFYVLHQPAIVLVAFFAVQWKVGILPKWLVISALALALVLGQYVLVIRRVNGIRWLFGMKPLQRPTEPNLCGTNDKQVQAEARDAATDQAGVLRHAERAGSSHTTRPYDQHIYASPEGGTAMATLSHSSLMALIRRRPVVTFVALTFIISWCGILLAVGPAGLASRDFEFMPMALAYPFMLLGPSVAAILLTALLDGKAGLRDLLTRALRWRVGARWYAVALLTAPVCILAVLLALTLVSPSFLPELGVTPDKMFLLLYSMAAGLVVGICWELGWTGFVVPRIRRRYGVLATGLIVGLVFGAWTGLIVFWASRIPSGGLSLALYLPAVLLTWQTAYRVLMVWVYDRTASLLLAILMQASLTTFWTSLTPHALAGVPLVIYYLVLTAALSAVIGVVALANGGRLSRPEQASATPPVEAAEKVAIPS
jgi:hypothetical protein